MSRHNGAPDDPGGRLGNERFAAVDGANRNSGKPAGLDAC
jgi:hypothetical protein